MRVSEWRLIICNPSRCAGGPRQQSELLRRDRGRHGRSHRLLGQFPPDLELNQPPVPLLCSPPSNPPPSWPNTAHPSAPPWPAGLDLRGEHCVNPKSNSPHTHTHPLHQPSSPPATCPPVRKLPTLSTFPRDVFLPSYYTTTKRAFQSSCLIKKRVKDKL